MRAASHWFFETIRKHPSRPTTKLVAFLVENDPSEIEGAVLAGADSILLKPFTRETLEAMLDDVGFLASRSAEGAQLASRDAALPAIATPEHPEHVLEFSDAAQPGPA